MKKSVKALMIVALLIVVASALCMFLPAFFTKDGAGQVMALDILLKDCFANIGSRFNFADPEYFKSSQPSTFIYVGLIALVGIIYLVWLIVIIAKKKGKSLIAFFLTLIGVAGAFLIADIYYFNTMYGEGAAFVAEHYGPFFSKFTVDGTENLLIADGQNTNLLSVLCAKSFGEYTLAGFPVVLTITGLASAGLSAVSYLLVVITAFADMAAPRRVKKAYAVGESKDDNFEEEPLTSTDELREMMVEEPVVEEEPVSEPEPEPVEEEEVYQEPYEEEPVEELKKEEPVQPAPVAAPVVPQASTVVINQYFGNNNVAPAQPQVKEEKEDQITREEIREMVKEEIEKSNLLKAEDVRMIFREELERLFQPVEEEQPEEPVVEEEPVSEPEPEPVVEEPAPVEEPVAEPEPAPVEETVAEPEPEPVKEGPVLVEEPKAKIVRIPFTDRCEMMSEEQRSHFNELKAEIMSYGVKSRISNSGDTFRLHTKTYVKMVVAGKGLKLYLAIDPTKYEGSTIPFNDVGHKAIYKDIPFAFKVKSELSLRRAKDLIAEAMASGELVKGEVVEKDYVQEIIDNKESVEEDGEAETED